MDKETWAIIGGNIRARRIELGLTQSELAKNAGISISTLQRIEKGKTHMRITIAMALSRSLDMSIDSFI